MSEHNTKDGDPDRPFKDNQARFAALSTSNEWAISSPETPATPLMRSGIDGTLKADEDEDNTVDEEGEVDSDVRPSTVRLRQLNGLGLQHGKRGSSESRKDRRASLTMPQNPTALGSQTALQELRDGIDSLKALRVSSGSLNFLANGGNPTTTTAATSIEPVSHDHELESVKALPSPPTSVANGSPVLRPRDHEEEPPALRRGEIEVRKRGRAGGNRASSTALDLGAPLEPKQILEGTNTKERTASTSRLSQPGRVHSTPVYRRKTSSSKGGSGSQGHMPTPKLNKDLPPLKMDRTSSKSGSRYDQRPPSPVPEIMPLPPLSMPAFLQLELSSSRPTPLYMYRPSTTDYPYEPTSAKVERLLNFLLLPPQLERVLWFGTIACVDAWLYNFTILPIRFCTAVAKLLRSVARNFWSEIRFLAEFVPLGLSRLWQRQVGHPGTPTPMTTPVPEGDAWGVSSRRGSTSQYPFPLSDGQPRTSQPAPRMSRPKLRKHRRTRSVASTLVSAEKADIVKGCLIITSTFILMRFDASMMYHSIRGQAAIKLYVIYNVLEVFDRLFSAIGQDILECLFSSESLSRHPNGRSKILRPLSLFPLALVYVLIHATALYYQVITLNVAVNSYSNALLTLLMSNQFVEIKSTVFKRIEKENLFQMTCADVVERFQLWLMLMIIAGRNIIETSTASLSSSPSTSTAPPPSSPTLLPFSFTMFPSLSFSQILSPFILVLGTETLVDWLKHAYITKFNNVKPNLYGRFLDVLAKDYYGHAFADPNLMKRIGLPVIPLTCLAIRAAVQTYHMAREQLVPAPLPPGSSVTGISPTTAAALQHIDSLLLRVVGSSLAANPATTDPSGATTVAAVATAAAAATTTTSSGNISNSTHPAAAAAAAGTPPFWLPSSLAARLTPSWLPTDVDALLDAATSLVLAAALFLVLLAAKLVLGMLLLRYARQRYARMKAREHHRHNENYYQDGRRSGGWGSVEVDEDKRRWIYADDPDRLRKLRERDRENREREGLGPIVGQPATAATAAGAGAGVGDKEDKEGGRETKDAPKENVAGANVASSGINASAAAAPKKGQNYEAVERYKLGGSKRIW